MGAIAFGTALTTLCSLVPSPPAKTKSLIAGRASFRPRYAPSLYDLRA